jgi:tetratricopeptide (TPR) repeat protein
MMRRAVEFYLAVGADMVSAYYLSWLAEACFATQRVDEGLAAVDQGLNLVGAKLAVFAEPELHRLKGELLVLRGELAEAEECLRTAHTIARNRGATLLEARASLSLGRFFASQGRKRDSIPLLRLSFALIAPDEPLAERLELRDLGQELEWTP